MKNHRFDIVLCDYHLGPGKNGQQILEQIRFEKLLPDSAVFMMITAESNSEMVVGAIECQPDGYLMKPFNQAMLQSRLNKLISLKETLAPITNAINSGHPDLAISLCHEIAMMYPKYVSHIKHMEADIYLKNQQYEKAKTIYLKVLAIRPIPWAQLGLGQVYYHQGEYHQAIKVLQKLIGDNKMSLQAYDWLAKAFMQVDDNSAAEQVLKQAVEISPQGILRQMDLGKLALKNGNIDVAENSFRHAVRLGRNSIHKDPANYTNLARTLIPKLTSQNDSVRRSATEETFSVLKEVRSDYKHDKAIALEVTLLETQSFKELKKEDKAKQSLDAAASLYETYGSQMPTELRIDMAKMLSSMGKQEDAEEVASVLVADNQGNDELAEALGTFVETSELNSKGIALYREGKYLDAIDAFEEACKEYPTSISINLNAIQAITKYFELKGISDDLIEMCEAHFDSIRTIDATDKRYRRYRELKKLYSGFKSKRNSNEDNMNKK